MNKRIILIAVWFLFLVVACTPPPPPVADPTRPPPTSVPPIAPAEEKKPELPDRAVDKQPPKDEELFIQGLQQAAEAASNHDDDGPARHTLETLVDSYPHSKWREAALEYLRLLGAVRSSRDQLRAEQVALGKASSEKTKSLLENEQLKKELRALNEKYQTELSTLQQENEQLKKDIQLLKNLEIELEKREKKLR